MTQQLRLLSIGPTMLLAACSAAVPFDPAFPAWSKVQIASLRAALAAAPREALPLLDSGALDSALDSGDETAIRRAALDLATRLATAHLRGCTPPSARGGWMIEDAADAKEIGTQVREVIASGKTLDSFIAGLNPVHPDFVALTDAYAAEADPLRRLSLARNIERWRWMPQSLGEDFVLVNIPMFETALWRGGSLTKRWPVVVGKVTTPTPIFTATATAVTFNPWWEVPPSIVQESGGRLSARRGYVRVNGRYRQRPGPGNSLGKMKVAMANSHNIYLHDTPSQRHFGLAERAYSHGCVRVSDAIGFAATLLEATKSRSQINQIAGLTPKPLALRSAAVPKEAEPAVETTTVPLASGLPVYMAYFTVSRSADGNLAFARDVYGLDAAIPDPRDAGRQCSM